MLLVKLFVVKGFISDLSFYFPGSVVFGFDFTIYACFLNPSPPFCWFATGGDSLESKVIFIQLSEWGSPLECVTNKEFTARVIAPQDTAA